MSWADGSGFELTSEQAAIMARGGIARLRMSDLKAKTPGFRADGGNLYLQVTRGNNGHVRRSWIFRFKLPGGRQRDLGLGGLDAIGLARARDLAKRARELLATGIDPIEQRDQERAKAAAAVKVPTFDEVAKAYIAAHRPSWRNPVHARQWETTLKTYASPVIGKLPVNLITTDHVMRALEPIWHDKTDTAKRVRGRIETVLNFATARKFREGDNPARWNGHLSELLARPSRLAPVQHHAALDYRSVGDFMAQLQQREGIAPLALEFAILTAARTGEVLGATWNEIDLDEAIWTVPAHRIKAGREHRVPLSDAALAVLHRARDIARKIGGAAAKSGLVFPNVDTGGRLSPNALLALLKRMKRADLTAHGFRSTFRDWAAEQSNFPNHVIEMALAHAVGDKVEAAYRRGDLFDKRREAMTAWANYCGPEK